ncbi:MAG: hypothetical protein ACFHWZ_03260 [Phycisphaerales bacterium]
MSSSKNASSSPSSRASRAASSARRDRTVAQALAGGTEQSGVRLASFLDGVEPTDLCVDQAELRDGVAWVEADESAGGVDEAPRVVRGGPRFDLVA